MAPVGPFILTLWRAVWTWYSPRTLLWRSALGLMTAQHRLTQATTLFRRLRNPVRSPDPPLSHPARSLRGNYFVEVGWSAAAAGVGLGRQGDIVIDGGACWGDTSLYFARQVEHVFAYECDPDNLAIFRRNMDLNPGLASRITLISKALWGSSGARLFFSQNGPGSHAVEKATRLSVETQSIDNLVSERSLSRVDFIKMDSCRWTRRK